MTFDRTTLCALLLVAGGCSKGSGDDSSGGECNVLIGDTFPEAGANDVCFRSDIEFEIEGGDEEAVITLVDASGADVPGTTTPNGPGTLVAFHPDASLEPNASYTATLTYCSGGVEELSFTTDAYGEPLVDAAALLGNVYVVDLKNDSRFHKPPGVSNVLQPMLTRKIWLEVLASSASSITLRLAVAAEGSTTEQDMCIPTVDFVDGELAGPTFTVGPNDIVIPIGTELVALDDVIATGTFATDGQSFGCGGFTGLIDTRPLVPLMKGSGDAYVCDLLGAYGATCVECADGANLCLTLEVDQAVAPTTTEVTVVEVTQQDVDDNPKCP
jgi:hypothetical protein